MIFFSIFDMFTAPVEWAGAGIVMIVLGWLTKKYILPFLNTALKKQMAEYVLLIADEATDQLVAKYPKNEAVKFADKAVDKIMDVCGVKKEVALRAVEASFGRKKKDSDDSVA